jgi:hypothetical protein
VRVRHVDVEAERLSLSLLHTDGSPIAAEEAEARRDYAESSGGPTPPATGTTLGPLLERALRPRNDADQGR